IALAKATRRGDQARRLRAFVLDARRQGTYRRTSRDGCQTTPGSSASTVTVRRYEQHVMSGAPAAQPALAVPGLRGVRDILSPLPWRRGVSSACGGVPWVTRLVVTLS